MAKITIQFHAVFSEVVEYITPIVREFSLNLVLLKENPFAICLFDVETRMNVFCGDNDFSRPYELIIFREDPNCNVTSRTDFIKRNPEMISIRFGVLTEDYLGQSVCSVETTDLQFEKIARKVTNSIKRNTRAGVLAVNANTGDSVFMKTFRYTKRALDLERSGIKMKPFAGGNLIYIES